MKKCNSGFHYISIVDKPTTLIEFLQNYKNSSINGWIERIQNGQVVVDGVSILDPTHSLTKGQTVDYFRLPWIEPEIPTYDLPILFEDENIRIINKPSGIPVLPGGIYYENTVLRLISNKYNEENSWPAHRLGTGTSGILLTGKTKLSRKKLSEQFQNNKLHKSYLAILDGTACDDLFEVKQPIGKIKCTQMFNEYIWNVADKGKSAYSLFKVLWRDITNNRTLCKVTISTGRPHQIRIHSAFSGYPLYGDPLYGKGSKLKISNEDVAKTASDYNEDENLDYPVFTDCGYFLHCWEMHFSTPTNELMKVICPPPETILELLKDYPNINELKKFCIEKTVNKQ